MDKKRIKIFIIALALVVVFIIAYIVKSRKVSLKMLNHFPIIIIRFRASTSKSIPYIKTALSVIRPLKTRVTD